MGLNFKQLVLSVKTPLSPFLAVSPPLKTVSLPSLLSHMRPLVLNVFLGYLLRLQASIRSSNALLSCVNGFLFLSFLFFFKSSPMIYCILFCRSPPPNS